MTITFNCNENTFTITQPSTGATATVMDTIFPIKYTIMENNTTLNTRELIDVIECYLELTAMDFH